MATRTLLVSVLIAMMATISSAYSQPADDPMSAYYDAVLTVHNETTDVTRTLSFAENRTFLVSIEREGRLRYLSGLWGMKENDSVAACFQPSPLGGVEVPYRCLPLGGRKVSDRWTHTNEQGQVIDLSLAAKP